MTTTLTDAAPAAPDALQSHTPDPAGIAPASAVETPADAAPPAARHAEQDAPPVLILSGAPNNLPERSEPMPLTPELLADIRETLGDPEFPEDQIDMQLLHDIAIDAKAKMVESSDIAQQALSRATDAEKALADKTQELSRLSLSRGDATPATDPEVLMDRADVYLSRIDLLSERGDVTPAIATKLKAMVKTAAGPSVVMLSRDAVLEARPIEALLGLFDGAKLAPRLGEQSGTQAVALAREVPGQATPKAPVNPYADTIDAITATK